MKIEKNKLISLDNAKIHLRPISDFDTENIVRWRNHNAVRSQFIFREKFTNELHIKWLRSRVDSGKVIQYIIETSIDRQAIGSVYIRDIDVSNRNGEFGIFIGEDLYRSKGYGTEAMRLFIPYCFSLGFHRIYLRVIEENEIAIKSYHKVGFKQEGIFRDMVWVDGEYKNIIFMSILENEIFEK